VDETRRIVIVDIDHTMSDAAWRDPLIGRWDEYYREQAYDRPIEFVVDLVRVLSSAGREVVAVTGRPEAHWWATVKWMHQHNIPIDTIYMRPNGDYGSSPEVKCALVRENIPLDQIEFVLEDRDDCVAAYRQMGLNVLQVNFAGERHGKTAEAGVTHGRGEPEEPGDDPRRAERELRGGLSERGPEPDGPVPAGSGAQESE
jgi:phosphoglycolate phosphatase-like HAD superfamily hydrolase